MDSHTSTEIKQVWVKMARTYRKPVVPDHPEDRMSEIEHLLVVLRTHQKHKELLLDPVFYERVELLRPMMDKFPEYETGREAGDLILQTKPTHPILYIQFFEAIAKKFEFPAKVCRECHMKFHPIENPEKRSYCRTCM